MSRLWRRLMADRRTHSGLARCCAVSAISVWIAGCGTAPDAPDVVLTHAAQTGGRPGPIAFADGRVLIASGTYVTVHASSDVRPVGDRAPTKADPSLGVDLEDGDVIELRAEGDVAAARIESGRIAIIDIAERVPQILGWLDETGEGMAWLEGTLITLDEGGRGIRAIDTRNGRLEAHPLTNPCQERIRFLDAAGGRAIILCDDGELWSMDGESPRPMAFAELGKADGAAEWMVAGRRRVLVGFQRDDGRWAAAIDTDQGPEPGRTRRLRLASANDPIQVIGVAGENAFLATERSGMRIVRFDSELGVAEIGVARGLRGAFEIAGDSSTLAVRRTAHVRVFDAPDPRRLAELGDLPQPARVERVAISPDGQRAFTLSGGRPVAIGVVGLSDPTRPMPIEVQHLELGSNALVGNAIRIVADERSVGVLAEIHSFGNAFMFNPYGVIASFATGNEALDGLTRRSAASVEPHAGRWLALEFNGDLLHRGMNVDSMRRYRADVPEAESWPRDDLGGLGGRIVDTEVIDGRILVITRSGSNKRRGWIGFVDPWREPASGGTRIGLTQLTGAGFSGRPVALAVGDGRAYVGLEDGDIVAYDISDGASAGAGRRLPRVGRVADVGAATRLVVDGDMLFALVEGGTLTAVDITPGQPMRHAPVAISNALDAEPIALDIAAAGGLLITAEGEDGMGVYRVGREAVP